ncbi:DUF4232 domain-containing protein [Streptomyces sp. RFCAC02]|uniref:DUF4232 domain-containing protein n=1 Tax=Streptomyces sp. RFCAC02 TaxID=2499143 RepID=UPI00143E0B29|nr:DUF4232 domain-containing protein [Streptomyces sp. RFCAC02]
MRTVRISRSTGVLTAAALAAVLSTTAFAPSAPSGAPVAACTDTTVELTTTLYENDSAQHMLLTATNTGDETCALYAYPLVIFYDRDDYIGPLESAMEDVTIAPGDEAYAGLLLFRIDAPTDAVPSMSVLLQGRTAEDDPAAPPIEVPMPGGFVNIDDNPLVTYWNTSRESVEDHLFPDNA